MNEIIRKDFFKICLTMSKAAGKSKENENALSSILDDKSLKVKSKIGVIGQLLLDAKISVDELIEMARLQKDSNKANLIEAMELASKTSSEIINDKAFEFAIECLAEKAPRVKWESARLIGNTAHLFPKQVTKAIPKLLDNAENEGTVVRWSAAFALSQIIQFYPSLNKELLPAIESLLKREKQNSIRKIYQNALKKVKA
jgi:HEAT repeat protein